jgi:hypothetical protein
VTFPHSDIFNMHMIWKWWWNASSHQILSDVKAVAPKKRKTQIMFIVAGRLLLKWSTVHWQLPNQLRIDCWINRSTIQACYYRRWEIR